MRTPRLSGLFIDCPEATFEDGVRFWAAAFAVEPAEADSPEYVSLPGAIPGMVVEVQRVADAARYHIDFPATDVEAEVARMEGLGAVRVGRVETWWVMRAPTGHLFCVVPVD
jgi:hypothetical protein